MRRADPILLGLIVLACVVLSMGVPLLAVLFCLGVAFGMNARAGRVGPRG